MLRYKLTVVVVLLALLLTAPMTTPARAQTGPEAAFRAFMDAWNAGDFPAMYALLHPQSQQLTAEPVFTTRYQETAASLGLTGVEYRIVETHMQGMSAAITYDATLQTSVFGQITDSDRVMRLVQDGGAWKVAWTTMDILNGLAGNARLETSGSSQPRAAIYDRNTLPLASNGEVIGMYARQERMPDPDACIILIADLMNEYIRITRGRFQPYAPETLFIIGWLPVEMFNDNRDRLTTTCAVETNISPVQQIRTYYGGSISFHSVGYVGQMTEAQVEEYVFGRGYEQGALIGQYGIEAAYETTLAGQPERVLRVVEPGGAVLREIGSTEGTPPQPVVLTLDRRMQQITAEAMADAYNNASGNWGAWGTTDTNISAGGAAVVLDVNSGAILALVSYPLVNPLVFNPNAPIDRRDLELERISGDTRRPLANRATQEIYAPGSVYKVISHAAILDAGLIGYNDAFDCDLFWDGRPFGDLVDGERADWRVADDLDAAGTVTPAQALMASCNPFYWQYAGVDLYEQMGRTALADYSRRMGLGDGYDLRERFGIPESPAALVEPTNVTASINASTGQGDVALPPIQMAVAVAAIANGGTVYEPYLVQQVGGVDGAPVTFQAQPRVLNTLDFAPGVLEDIRAGMCGVTTNEDFGTAYIRFGDRTAQFHPPAVYTLCGKTGTAEQQPLPPHAWFVAYAPAENPQIAVMVMAQNSREGSQIAAPITRRILDEWFNVPPANYADWPDWWSDEPYFPLTPTGQSAGQ